MEQPEQLRIGLAGCGMHGANLAQAVVRSNGLRLVGCADPDTNAAERTANLASDVNIYPTIDALLDSFDLDAVLIATPHDVLAPAALSALRAGKHILLEKPMALSDEQAQDIESAAPQRRGQLYSRLFTSLLDRPLRTRPDRCRCGRGYPGSQRFDWHSSDESKLDGST
jgi:predicted dehydrogenase